MRSPLRELARAIRNVGPPPMTSSRSGGAAVMLTRRGEGALSMMEAVSTVFAVVSRLSNSTARVDWKLYRSAPSGKDEDRVEVVSHAALDLWRKPNDFHTRQDLVEVGQQHIELAGKACVVVARSGDYGRGTRAGDLPLELWPVRPDRMAAVPDAKKFQTGWMYTSPDGEQIPLRLDEVICLRTPNPRDPYEGLSPVQSLMTDLDSARYSALWNRNFFLNGAAPGGIVQVDRRLSDDEFDEMSQRWREQHQGVANAHRVAILEQATYTETKITQRDMQFVDLRNISREMIREAWQIPKFALGDVTDVNRATAEASSDWFGSELSEPRLERWKSALNVRFLPMYGPTAKGLEFDYEPVVSEDQVAANEDLAARVDIARALYELGVEWADALKIAGLPDTLRQRIEVTSPEPVGNPDDGKVNPDRALVEALQKMYLAVGVVINWQEAREIANRFGANLDLSIDPTPDKPEPAPFPAPGDPAAPPPDPAPPAQDGPQPPQDPGLADALLARRVTELLDLVRGRPRNADDPPDDPEAVEAIDLSDVQSAWESALDALLAVWTAAVLADWISDLVDQIADVLRSGVLTGLATLKLSTEDAVTRVANAMVELAETAARHVVKEAAKQDTEVKPVLLKRSDVEDAAQITVELLANGIAISAGREAQRRTGPGADADDVAEQVGQFLQGLSTADPAKQLGGALTAAQNAGRVATLTHAPTGALYASEAMDTNTCGPCKAIHGRWIANTEDLAPVWKLYPVAGYIDCKGGIRCRGTIVGVWRPKTTEGGEG